VQGPVCADAAPRRGLGEIDAMFKGSLVALITPMRRDGAIDAKAYQDFIAWQIAEGTHGVVPVGTTGESPTLSHDEHKRVVELCRVPSSNS
jgi:dihydrodipicolinate synthase (EC 4.2.1.52)